MNAGQFAKQRAKIERRAAGRTAFVRKAMEHLVRDAGAVVIAIRGHVVAWKMPDGGVVCVKRRYSTGVVAVADLYHIKRRARDIGHIPVRAYACPWCLGWHLTSQQAAANDNNPAG